MGKRNWDAYVLDGTVLEVVPEGQPPMTIAAATGDCEILPAVYAAKPAEHVFKVGGSARYEFVDGKVIVHRETKSAALEIRLSTAKNRMKAVRERMTEAAAFGEPLPADDAAYVKALKSSIASLEAGELVDLPVPLTD